MNGLKIVTEIKAVIVLPIFQKIHYIHEHFLYTIFQSLTICEEKIII